MKLEIVFKDGRKEIFDSVASFNVIKEQVAPEVAKTPTEGKLFEINPLGMDRSRFAYRRGDEEQELTRKFIQEAFVKVDLYPEKYASPFYTLIPKVNWNTYKTVAELKEYANDLGGQMADWVEQALEWAQRISNGESWKVVCNNPDTAYLNRAVEWKNGYMRLIGGSRYNHVSRPASSVLFFEYSSEAKMVDVVPLVVFKKK